MTERSTGSMELTADKMNSLGDTNNVLPNLSKADAPVSVTLTIDRSVGKIAAWVIGFVIAGSILIGAGAVLAIWMVIQSERSERESRMVEYYIHELDGKLIAAGFIKPSQAFDKERIQREIEREKQK